MLKQPKLEPGKAWERDYTQTSNRLSVPDFVLQLERILSKASCKLTDAETVSLGSRLSNILPQCIHSQRDTAEKQNEGSNKDRDDYRSRYIARS